MDYIEDVCAASWWLPIPQVATEAPGTAEKLVSLIKRQLDLPSKAC
jgi:hypothetical protein